MSTIVDLAIFPMDKGASVSAYVARADRKSTRLNSSHRQ